MPPDAGEDYSGHPAWHPPIVSVLKAGKFPISAFLNGAGKKESTNPDESSAIHAENSTNKCEDARMLFTESITLLCLPFHVRSIQVMWDTFNLKPGSPVLWWAVGNTRVEKQKEQHFPHNKTQRAYTEPVSLKI